MNYKPHLQLNYYPCKLLYKKDKTFNHSNELFMLNEAPLFYFIKVLFFGYKCLNVWVKGRRKERDELKMDGKEKGRGS